MIKTVNLSANAETCVAGLGGDRCRIQNRTAGTLYVSGSPNITPCADGVMSIPSGRGDYFSYSMTSDKVYLLSAAGGDVEISGEHYYRPFDNAAGEKGGIAVGNPVVMDGLQGGVPFSDMVVSGKNLLPLMSESVDFGGVSCTVNTDGTITLNGTSEKQGSIDIVYKIPIKSGVYTLSGCPESGSNNTFAIRAGMGTANTLYGRDYGNGLKITVDADTVLTVSVQILGVGIVFDNLIFRPQLELGSTPTAYEPPIMGRELTIHACGKNLIPYPYNRTSGVYNGLTVDISDDGKFSINGTATADMTIFEFAKQSNPIYLSGGVSYTLNCSQQYNIDSFNLFFKIYHADKTYSGYTKYPASFTAKNGDYLVGSLWIKSGSVVNAENVEIQLELGSTPTAYEPYRGSTYTITPDSNPYTVPDDIRQQDGMNILTVSAGELTVSYSKTDPALSRIYKSIDSLATAIVAMGAEK